MQKFILSIIAIVAFLSLNAQQINNVQVVKNGDNAIITYDISGDKPGQTFTIKVECVFGNGKQIPIGALALTGDINDVSAGTGKKIEFHALNDLKMMVGDNFMFQLAATEIYKPEPYVNKNTEIESEETEVKNEVTIDSNNVDSNQAEEVFIIVENPASFQGGDLNTFRDWVSQNMLYPKVAAENDIQGKVYIQFAVNSKGEVVQVKVLQGVDSSLDNESVRLISSSPKWTPATQGGRKVCQQFVIPLSFVLTDSGTSTPPPNQSNADSIKNEKPANREKELAKMDIETSFVTVDLPATFQGGDLNTFRIWVSQNMGYPAIAAENGIQGKVYLQFVVNSDGNVVDVEVLRGVDPSLDKESIRVINSSPRWTPAKLGGKNVGQQFVIPLSYVLQ